MEPLDFNTPQHQLMTPTEVADLFRVNARTVSRWNNQGKLSCIRTIGNHRRFRRDEVMRLYEESKNYYV